MWESRSSMQYTNGLTLGALVPVAVPCSSSGSVASLKALHWCTRMEHNCFCLLIHYGQGLSAFAMHNCLGKPVLTCVLGTRWCRVYHRGINHQRTRGKSECNAWMLAVHLKPGHSLHLYPCQRRCIAQCHVYWWLQIWLKYLILRRAKWPNWRARWLAGWLAGWLGFETRTS